MITDEDRAQRWHDTDHGSERGPALKDQRYRVAVDEPEPDWVSSCWCCCQLCNPDWNPRRPNPFWKLASTQC